MAEMAIFGFNPSIAYREKDSGIFLGCVLGLCCCWLMIPRIYALDSLKYMGLNEGDLAPYSLGKSVEWKLDAFLKITDLNPFSPHSLGKPVEDEHPESHISCWVSFASICYGTLLARHP
jgi:hypothetical protein